MEEGCLVEGSGHLLGFSLSGMLVLSFRVQGFNFRATLSPGLLGRMGMSLPTAVVMPHVLSRYDSTV